MLIVPLFRLRTSTMLCPHYGNTLTYQPAVQDPSWPDTCLPILLRTLHPHMPLHTTRSTIPCCFLSPLPETFSDPKVHSFGFPQCAVLMSFCTSHSFSLLHLPVTFWGWKLCPTQCLAHNKCLKVLGEWMEKGKPQMTLRLYGVVAFQQLDLPNAV